MRVRRIKSLRVRFFGAWYDLWVGCYIDLEEKRAYFLPVPCFGVVVEWR